MLAFVTNLSFERSTEMKEYRCNLCGYIYDPVKGDPNNNMQPVQPGTPFESLAADWACPLCGVDKKEFAEEK